MVFDDIIAYSKASVATAGVTLLDCHNKANVDPK